MSEGEPISSKELALHAELEAQLASSRARVLEAAMKRWLTFFAVIGGLTSAAGAIFIARGYLDTLATKQEVLQAQLRVEAMEKKQERWDEAMHDQRKAIDRTADQVDKLFQHFLPRDKVYGR